MKKTIVVAIGGNSLIDSDTAISIEDQYAAAKRTAEQIAILVRAGHHIVLTHGNGPQVGFQLRRSEMAKEILPVLPLDAIVASTQGIIGYLLQRALYNVLDRTQVATLLTQVIVDADDPAFKKPSKPIGRFFSADEARIHKTKHNWNMVEDSGRGYRRIVPSPLPKKIVELEIIQSISSSLPLILACGGGGIPVIENKDGTLTGIEAVIDKDLTSALLAKAINADYLIISTGVSHVSVDFGKPSQRPLDEVSATELRQYAADNQFPPGSMLPKINACLDFVEQTDKTAFITCPNKLSETLAGTAGTKIVSDRQRNSSCA